MISRACPERLRQRKTSMADDVVLWAITTYFNPFRRKRRRANYDVFRSRLPMSVRLVTVEHAHDGEFELGDTDADLLVRVSGGDVMWQKERLLNIALQHVPASCQAVAWLDCDIVLSPEDWPARAVAALANHALVQPFSDAYWLGPDQLPEELPDPAMWESGRRSLGYQHVRGTLGRVRRRSWSWPPSRGAASRVRTVRLRSGRRPRVGTIRVLAVGLGEAGHACLGPRPSARADRRGAQRAVMGRGRRLDGLTRRCWSDGCRNNGKPQPFDQDRRTRWAGGRGCRYAHAG